MRMNNVLAFLGGAVVGLIGGIVMADIYYKKAIDEVYEERTNADNALDEYRDESEEKPNVVKGVPKREREKRDKKTPYHTLYRKKKMNDDELLDGEEEMDDDELMEIEAFHEANFDKTAIVIQSCGEAPHWYEKRTMLYYQYSDTLIEESDDTVVIDEEIDYLFGDLLDSTGFTDNDVDTLLIMSYRTDCIYEIQKMQAAYDDTAIVDPNKIEEEEEDDDEESDD